MRTLKRTMCLVLALVMVLGLGVTSASAVTVASDYNDYDKVTHKVAVDVMTAIGVLDGMGDDTFSPEGTLEREQAAKIITYLMLGPEDAETVKGVAAPFEDVVGRWSAGYIAYCYNQGIVDGVGGNSFEPSGALTGLQFAKMLLCALGYDQDKEGMTGDEWSINTAKLAVKADLDDGLEGVNLAKAITREQAAQMALNTLKANEVEYIYTVSNSYTVKTTTQSWGKNISDDGVSSPSAADPYIVQFAEEHFPKLVLTSKQDGSTDYGRDEFKRPGQTWLLNGAVVVFEADKYINAYNGDFTEATAKALDRALDVSANATVKVYYNGTDTSGYAANNKFWQAASPTTNGLWYETGTKSIGMPGMEIEVYKHRHTGSDTGTGCKLVYDVVAREAWVAQVTQAANKDGQIKVKVYEAGALSGKEYTIEKTSGETLPYYAGNVYNPLASCALHDIVAVYMATTWGGSTDPTQILGVEALTRVDTTIVHIRDNGKNINSTLETKEDGTFRVANEALWTNHGGTANSTGLFGTIDRPTFSNNQSGRKVQTGSAVLYTLNGFVMFIDQTPGAAKVDEGYAYLWDTLDDKDGGWKNEQGDAIHQAKLYLDGDETMTTAHVIYTDPNGVGYSSLTDATDGAYNVDNGGILVHYTHVDATSTAVEHYVLDIPTDNTNGTQPSVTAPLRRALTGADGTTVAVKNNVAQGTLPTKRGGSAGFVYDDATVFYVVTGTGLAAKNETVKVYTGVRNVPTMYLASTTRVQLVLDSTGTGITNLVRSVVIKNPGDGTTRNLADTYFIVGGTQVTQHSVLIDGTTIHYYGYKAVVGNTGEVTEVLVKNKITTPVTYTLIGQEGRNLTYDATAASAGYTVIDNSGVAWTQNDETGASANDGSVDNTVFTKVTNLKTGDYNNGVISFDGSAAKSYLVTTIPIYLYNATTGDLESISYTELKTGMTGYCVLEKDTQGNATGAMVALYVTE